jgi:hypothetical protein
MNFKIKNKLDQLVEAPKQAYTIALIALGIACVAILIATRGGKHATR